jgi:putative lipoprotein
MRIHRLTLLLTLAACQAEGRLSKVARDTVETPGVSVRGTGIDTVHATVAYDLERVLPSGSHVKVSLVDISRADAAATVISSEDRVTTGDQGPFSFALPFVLDQIPMTARLAVRASIEAEGNLLFTSTQVYPVVTQGAPKSVQVMVTPVR